MFKKLIEKDYLCCHGYAMFFQDQLIKKQFLKLFLRVPIIIVKIKDVSTLIALMFINIYLFQVQLSVNGMW